jgi:hypothetical protein
MAKKKDIHPSIIAALNGKKCKTQTTKITANDGDTLLVERFTFGDEEPTLLAAIKAVIKLSEDSRLSGEFFIGAEEALNYISKRLDINHEQALMFSLIVNFFHDQQIYIMQFCQHLDCAPIDILPYMKEIEGLVERDFVICNQSGRWPTYRIPYHNVEALNNDEVPQKRKLTNLSCKDLVFELSRIFEQRNNDELTIEGMEKRLHLLIDSNKELHFSEMLSIYDLGCYDFIVLLYMVSRSVNYFDNHIQLHEFSDFIENDDWRKYRSSLLKEETGLQQRKLIEYANDEGFGNRKVFCLSMKAKRVLFKELDIKLTQDDGPAPGLKSHKDITAHQLFFDEATSKQVDELTSLLNEENYQQIHQRLQDKGFRCGFTCLFYGTPGTGKTETVLQLARQTGRDIMQVNVSEIKSKWVGDSEKNIKALFDDYRQKVKDCKVTPILLFNEADAIINRRQEMAERSVDKMENSIQNIILQEMETLDGILIATTNLEQNMDKAFERRFLYKIKFNKPSVEARQHIWQAMIPSLSDDAASQLASRYDFSGGQIENIARHHAIDSILHGTKADDLQTLITHCDQERLEKQRPKIGF